MSLSIQSTPNGPLKVKGDFIIKKSDGSILPHQGDSADLCRCGQSATKPFCDGSHKAAAFKAE